MRAAASHRQPVRRPTSHWMLWLFALALVLRTAMPMLASVSAEVQGKAVVEVCTVYGMAMVPMDDHHAPTSKPSLPKHSDHTDHCPLTALALLAGTSPSEPLTIASAGVDVHVRSAHRSTDALDATERWAAQLRHGPPSLI